MTSPQNLALTRIAPTPTHYNAPSNAPQPLPPFLLPLPPLHLASLLSFPCSPPSYLHTCISCCPIVANPLTVLLHNRCFSLSNPKHTQSHPNPCCAYLSCSNPYPLQYTIDRSTPHHTPSPSPVPLILPSSFCSQCLSARLFPFPFVLPA